MSEHKLCACGCGETVKRVYVRGHNPRTAEVRKLIRTALKDHRREKRRKQKVLAGKIAGGQRFLNRFLAKLDQQLA